MGIHHVLYTDISRDGGLCGVNVAATAALASESGLDVIAAGGVASVDDIRALKDADADIAGVVVGRALYTGDITLADAIQAANAAKGKE